MNERIRKLAKQAEEYAVSVCDQRTGVYQGKEYLEVVQEKFAELIIEECLNSTRGSITGLDAFNNIKQHFGVE